ncbi:MAG: DUF421 domain-containing protein [Oscillospiraceae bacterium]
MTVVFIRAVILYLLIIFSMRLMGKHQIGELQPSELAVTILISNIATLPVEDMTMPLFTGIIPILTLACLDVIMSWLGIKSKRLRNLTCGKPVVIISNGIIDKQKMNDIRFTSDDLMEALHSKDIFDISEVQFAVVETTGAVSVYQKQPFRNPTNHDLDIRGRSIDPPEVVVDDGRIIDDALKRTEKSKEYLEKILQKEKTGLSDVFLMTLDGDGNYSLIRNGVQGEKNR